MLTQPGQTYYPFFDHRFLLSADLCRHLLVLLPEDDSDGPLFQPRPHYYWTNTPPAWTLTLSQRKVAWFHSLVVEC